MSSAPSEWAYGSWISASTASWHAHESTLPVTASERPSSDTRAASEPSASAGRRRVISASYSFSARHGGSCARATC
eukprot:4621015-Prymnesium_polylepis.1